MWYAIVFFLGVGAGFWLAFAYMSWRQDRLGWLKRSAKRENRHLRRK